MDSSSYYSYNLLHVMITKFGKYYTLFYYIIELGKLFFFNRFHNALYHCYVFEYIVLFSNGKSLYQGFSIHKESQWFVHFHYRYVLDISC